MAPPNVPGKDTSASPRPNVTHGQGFPSNMNPRAHMGNPYGHFPPNGYGQRHPNHGGPGNSPQRPGYTPNYPPSIDHIKFYCSNLIQLIYNHLCPTTTDSASKLNISGCDYASVSVSNRQIGVFEKSNQKCFGSFLINN